MERLALDPEKEHTLGFVPRPCWQKKRGAVLTDFCR